MALKQVKYKDVSSKYVKFDAKMTENAFNTTKW